MCNQIPVEQEWITFSMMNRQTSQLEGITENCLLGELVCSPLSQAVFNPCRENVLNYTITCRLSFSMGNVTWLGGKDLIAPQRLDLGAFSKWDRVRVLVWGEHGWSSAWDCSVSSFPFLLMHFLIQYHLWQSIPVLLLVAPSWKWGISA